MNVIRWNIFVLISVLIQNVSIKNCEEINEDLKNANEDKDKKCIYKNFEVNKLFQILKIQLILIGKKKII